MTTNGSRKREYYPLDVFIEQLLPHRYIIKDLAEKARRQKWTLSAHLLRSLNSY